MTASMALVAEPSAGRPKRSQSITKKKQLSVAGGKIRVTAKRASARMRRRKKMTDSAATRRTFR